jgi:hypothetical protein
VLLASIITIIIFAPRDCWSLPGVWEMGGKVMANDEVVGLIERIKAAQAEYEGKYQQLVKVWQRQTEMVNHLICPHPMHTKIRHSIDKDCGGKT